MFSSRPSSRLRSAISTLTFGNPAVFGLRDGAARRRRTIMRAKRQLKQADRAMMMMNGAVMLNGARLDFGFVDTFHNKPFQLVKINRFDEIFGYAHGFRHFG